MRQIQTKVAAALWPIRWAAVITIVVALISVSLMTSRAHQSTPYTQPRWMNKLLAKQAGGNGSASGVNVGANVNVSNEPGPQSETFVAVDTITPRILAGASNEIFRNPQRTYFSLDGGAGEDPRGDRSEEHTSELQSRQYLVCRLLLEKKKKITTRNIYVTVIPSQNAVTSSACGGTVARSGGPSTGTETHRCESLPQSRAFTVNTTRVR